MPQVVRVPEGPGKELTVGNEVPECGNPKDQGSSEMGERAPKTPVIETPIKKKKPGALDEPDDDWQVRPSQPRFFSPIYASTYIAAIMSAKL